MNNLEMLLEEIKQLKQKHNNLRKDEAQGFNVFSLLLKSGDEVNLHSKFIYELLNPKGSHHQGSLFLDLFLETLNLEKPKGDILAFREKHNIDILLQSSSQTIIIENKVYSEDHSSQLNRYVKNIRNQGYKKRNILLIYLTLFGHAPTEKKLNHDVKLVSYRRDIVAWLEAAILKTSNIAILRETIRQYLNLVKQLTYQSSKKGFIMDTRNFLLQGNNLQSIIELEAPIIEAKIKIQYAFWQTLISQLIPHYAFEFYNMNNGKGLKKSIRRYYQQQRNTKDYGIRYQVDENLYFFIELRNNIYYGFEFIDEEKINEEQKEKLGCLKVSWREISSNIYWKYPDKPLDFATFTHQNIFDLIDKDKREDNVRKMANEILGLISNYTEDNLCLVK